MRENDLRVIKTKKTIENSFWNLLKKKDFEKITIKEITDQALIGKTTFYYHYVDKYDLAQKLLDKYLNEYKITLSKRLQTGIQSKLLDTLNTLSSKILLLRKIHFSNFNVDTTIKQILADVFQKEIHSINDPLAAKLLAAVVFESLLIHNDNEFPQNKEQLQKVMLELLNGLQEINKQF